MKTKYYSITQSGDAAEIYIYGDLTPYDPGNTDEQPYNAMQELSELDVKQIDVYIDSYGGSVSEGWSFYNALKKHPAKVRTFGVGFVASAALYPFMAGDERSAYATSVYFFHGVQSSDKETAQKMTEIGRVAFTENTGVDDSQIAQLQDAETWVSPIEMFQMGLATMLVGVETAVSATQNVRKKLVKSLFSQKADIPEEQKQKQEQEQEPPEAGLKEKPKQRTFFNFKEVKHD